MTEPEVRSAGLSRQERANPLSARRVEPIRRAT